jgi:hypothetical protein
MAMWPAPALLGGAVLVCGAILLMIQARTLSGQPWDLGLGLFRAAFFSLWLMRDFLFLQTMNLRPGRRPLIMGVLYMVVFYACAAIASLPFEVIRFPERLALFSIFYPAGLFVEPKAWEAARWAWVLAMAAQAALAAVFAALHWRALQALAAQHAAAEASAAPPAASMAASGALPSGS